MKPFTYAFALLACTGIALAQTPTTTNGGGQRQNTTRPAQKPKQIQTPQQKVIVNNRPSLFGLGGSIAAGVNGSDDCATAPAITGSGDFVFDNTTATTGAEGQHNGRQYNDIWWAWTAAFDGVASFSSCNNAGADAGSATYDTTLGVYHNGGICPGASEAPASYNDDGSGCSGFSSLLTGVSVTAGSTYMIQMGGWGASEFGSGVLSISNPNPIPNGSDDCASAPAVSGSLVIAFDNTSATTGTEGQHSTGATFNDIWWAWTADQNGLASFSTCNNTGADAGSATYDTTIGLYHNGAVCPGATEVPGSYNDDGSGCGGFSSLLTGVAVTAGSTYMIQVSGWGPSEFGTGDLAVNITSDPPPANDDCGTPVAISGQGSFAYDNTLASTGAEGQNEAICYDFGSSVVESDVWFSWTSDGDGVYVIETCGSAPDTKIAFYDGSGCPTAGAVACNDDTCVLQSQVTVNVTNGSTYTIQCGNFPGVTGGATTLIITASAPPATNDDCATPDAIVGQGSFAYDNGQATTGAEGQNEALCYDFGSSVLDNDVWFSWTADVTGDATVDTCGSGPDTKISAYDGSGCPSAGSIACNDDTCGLQSQITFAVTAGSTYTIQAGNFPGQAGGATALNIAISALPDHPFDDCATTSGVLSDGANLVDTTGTSYGSNPATTDATACGENNNVWYSYTAASDGLVVMALCDLAGNPAAGFDTKMSVHDACGGNTIACNDDYCGLASALAFSATAGTSYMVSVGGWGASDYGTGALSVISTLGSPFCVGDGSGTPCPCGNNAPSSFLPTGCVNSALSAGTLLAGGSASVSADSVVLVAAGVVPSLPGVFFSGTNAINGGSGVTFGDGLRCAGQNAVRIQVTGSDANGNAISTVEVSTNGQAYSNEVSAGDVLNYQYWYRDVAAGGPCGNSHNLTNALQVVWGA